MNQLSQWTHEKPRQYFPVAKKLLGKPTFIANVRSGMVYWKKKGNSLFAEHRLVDQAVYHCVPGPHYDFFYSSVKFFVPPKKRLDVLRISGSLTYDGLTKLLTARCASLAANIATLYLAMSVGSSEMKITEVKKKGLYSRYIQGTALSHTKMRQEMNCMKQNNRKDWKKELAAPFDPLAFSRCPKNKKG